MKIKKIIYLSLFLVIPQFFYGMMPEYQNTITKIDAIQGATTVTLILFCDQLEPIAVYAPATYQESLNDKQITIFMPNTVLAEGVAQIPGVIESIGSGVSIFLEGKLLKKLIADHKVVITIEVKP